MSAPMSSPATSPKIEPTGRAVLEVNDLHVAYGAIKAIRGVSFTVGIGETVAIVGANGAGKSTLMRALSGVMAIEAGGASFDGEAIKGAGAHVLAKRGMLHVPEGRGTIRMMTVWENLRLAYEIRPTDAPFEPALEAVFKRFPRLKERINQMAGDLSGGEQQMLSLARAIINRPKLLLVDEPSLGLSPLLTKEVFRVLQLAS